MKVTLEDSRGSFEASGVMWRDVLTELLQDAGYIDLDQSVEALSELQKQVAENCD